MERRNKALDKIQEEYFKLMKTKEESFKSVMDNLVKYFMKNAEKYFKDYLEKNEDVFYKNEFKNLVKTHNKVIYDYYCIKERFNNNIGKKEEEQKETCC